MELRDDDVGPSVLDRATTRLALFGAILVLVFGAGFGVGTLLGGDDDAPPTAPADTHSRHDHGGSGS